MEWYVNGWRPAARLATRMYKKPTTGLLSYEFMERKKVLGDSSFRNPQTRFNPIRGWGRPKPKPKEKTEVEEYLERIGYDVRR